MAWSKLSATQNAAQFLAVAAFPLAVSLDLRLVQQVGYVQGLLGAAVACAGLLAAARQPFDMASAAAAVILCGSAAINTVH